MCILQSLCVYYFFYVYTTIVCVYYFFYVYSTFSMCILQSLCIYYDLYEYFSFVGWIVLRMTAWVIVKREEAFGIDPYYPREEWHAYDPFLISEGLFGAGMISRWYTIPRHRWYTTYRGIHFTYRGYAILRVDTLYLIAIFDSTQNSWLVLFMLIGLSPGSSSPFWNNLGNYITELSSKTCHCCRVYQKDLHMPLKRS